MRLIDADKLADFITENEDYFDYVIEHQDREMLDDIINSIPAAYDIDKVVEKLESKKNELVSEGCSLSAHQLVMAIKIVKAGVRK